MDPSEHGRGALRSEPEQGCPEDSHVEPPFVLIEPLRRNAPLVFASPHSGRRYPPELLASTRISLISLRRSEDAYVDELFAGAAAHGAAVLSATVARSYIDLNRDAAELDLGHPHALPVVDLLNLAGDGQAHGTLLAPTTSPNIVLSPWRPG